MAKSITIGQDPKSTLVVAERHQSVDLNHATILRNGEHYFLTDHSEAGTTVNGTLLHNQSCEITHKDAVQLGDSYVLDWHEVYTLLQGDTMPDVEPDKVSETLAVPTATAPATTTEPEVTRAEPECLHKWNWGAFFLTPIWAICYGISCGYILLCFLPIASTVMRFILGARGNEYAWEKYNGTTEEATQFDAKQREWAIAGPIVFLICVTLEVVTGLASQGVF